MTAFVPLASPVLVLAAGACWRCSWCAAAPCSGCAVLVVVPPALLLPWLPALVADPAAAAAGGRPARPGPVRRRPGAVFLLLLHPGGPGCPPLAFSTAPLLLLALAALLRPDRPAARCWPAGLLAGIGLVAAVLQSRADVTAPTLEDRGARPGPGRPC